MNKNIIIHLIGEEIICINEDWCLIDFYLAKMNNNDDSVQFGNYIIPKTSINYIEFIKKEDK